VPIGNAASIPGQLRFASLLHNVVEDVRCRRRFSARAVVELGLAIVREKGKQWRRRECKH
jgi:hypothetical protein